MLIYLLRHGVAEPPRPGEPDSDRSLTTDGEAGVRAVARRAAASIRPDSILQSPYRRAVQTADILMEEIKFHGDRLATIALLPDADVRDAWNEIRAHAATAGVVLVGHQPLLSALAAYLLGFPDAAIALEPGSLACIETGLSREPRGALLWLISTALAGDP
jgi:phosphohistidine phosphatase